MLSASLIQLEYASKQWKSTFSHSPLCCGGHHCRILGKRDFFLGLSLVSTSTLKYLKFPSHRKMGAHHGWRSFAALFVTFPTEDSALMALPGLLWLGWVSLGACRNMCMCILPSKSQLKELAHICVLCSAIASPSLLSSSPIRLNPKPNARHNIRTRIGSRKPAGDL